MGIRNGAASADRRENGLFIYPQKMETNFGLPSINLAKTWYTFEKRVENEYGAPPDSGVKDISQSGSSKNIDAPRSLANSGGQWGCIVDGTPGKIPKPVSAIRSGSRSVSRLTVYPVFAENNHYAWRLVSVISEELVENVFQEEYVRIERIVSTSQSSSPDFWHDHSEGKWLILLRGYAILEFQDGPQRQRLFFGDYIYIPPHRKHRILSMTGKHLAVWLAVFVKQASVGPVTKD